MVFTNGIRYRDLSARPVLGRVGLGFDVLGAQLGPPRHFVIFKSSKKFDFSSERRARLIFPISSVEF